MKNITPDGRRTYSTGLIAQIRDFLNERQNPGSRIQVSAMPVDVPEIWSKPQSHVPGLLSLLVHVGMVAALIALSVTSYQKPKFLADTAALFMPSLSAPPAAMSSGGGGGGGTHQLTLASKGVLPPSSDIQLVPPTPIITNLSPELVADPTIISSIKTRLTGLLQLGDPNGVTGPPSAGEGDGGGIGNLGKGRGVGDQIGPGGPGCCGAGPGGGGTPQPPTLRVGQAGVVPPSCPVQVEPSYSDDARKARVQGVVLLAVTVQKDGTIEPNKVLQGLGYGLDDEAKKVLSKWKCNAGRFNGQAVALPIQIQINFHLY